MLNYLLDPDDARLTGVPLLDRDFLEAGLPLPPDFLETPLAAPGLPPPPPPDLTLMGDPLLLLDADFCDPGDPLRLLLRDALPPRDDAGDPLRDL